MVNESLTDIATISVSKRKRKCPKMKPRRPNISIVFRHMLICILSLVIVSGASATLITGRIATSIGKPVASAGITATNGGGSTTSGSDGIYSLTITSGWSGVVSVTKSGYILTPGARKYTSVTTDRTAQDYVATPEPVGGFFEQISTKFPAVGYAAALWGDVDGDGMYDLFFAGDAGTSPMIIVTAELFHNDGGTFSEVEGAGFSPVTSVSAGWSDYDGDGKIDLALSGWDGADSCKIYRNGGGGAFYDIKAELPGNMGASVAWADYNNDGRLDLGVNGWDGFNIYRNDCSGTFASVPPGIISRAKDGSTTWADYDNDGDMDLLVMGIYNNDQYGYPVPVTKLYRNENEVFTDSGITFTQLKYPSASWGDYDADGNLDLAICGSASWGYRYTFIYHNDGLGNLTDIAAPIVGVDHGNLAWADYDNDGDLDIAVCGLTGSSVVTKVYRNDNGTFVDTLAAVAGVMDGWLSWGDYDGDGNLDLLVTGATVNNINAPQRIVRLYRNKCPVVNTPPTAPTGLSARIIGKDLVLNWSTASDNQGMAGGLSYNVRIGTAPGQQDVMSACSDEKSGQRSIPAIGNAQKKLTWTLKGLAIGTPYYWSVQAVDSSFAGSAWGTSQTVSLVKMSGYVTRADGAPAYNVRMSANNGGGNTTSDKNGYYEVVVVSGWSGRITPSKTEYTFSPVNHNYSNVTSNITDQNITAIPPRWEGLTVGTGILGGAVAWGDFDNDGRMDLSATGGTSSVSGIDNPFDPVLFVFRNTDGSGDFTEALRNSSGYTYSSLAWGDTNGDGKLDLAVQGFRGTGGFPAGYVYNNTGGRFDSTVGISPGMAKGSLSWGDYNNDGLMDLLGTGTYYNGQVFAGYTDVYRNDKVSGTLLGINSGIAGASEGGSAWADYDNDGDLDVAVSGQNFTISRFAKIYRNDGGVFTDIGASFPGCSNARLAWTDYNNDGRLDLVLYGETQIGAGLVRIIKIYRNDGGGVFTDINASITAPLMAAIALSDYDNDGRVDLAIAGSSGYAATDAPVFKLYHNDGGDVFTEVSTSVTPVHRPGIQWGDLDNDGTLDLALAGMEQDGTIVTKVYRNNFYLDGRPANTRPTTPTGLSGVRNGSDITFSWQAASDLQTPAAGLTYNLRVGTTSGGNEVMSGMADANGWRKIPALGNAQKMLSWTLKNLPAGSTYYWSVQAIDTSYVGSQWASEQTVEPISSMSTSQIKMLSDNSQVRIDQATVSRAFQNFFYIEADDRYSGIRVEKTNHGLTLSARADVVGIVKTNSDGERYVEPSVASRNGTAYVQPVAMPIRSIGGGNWNYSSSGTSGQAGVKDSAGLNNIGLLITSVGTVTYSTAGYFYIDDGSGARDNSGHAGIKVLTNGFAAPDVDTYQRVTGISSCYKLNGIIYPLIRAWSIDDVQEIPTW